MHGIIIQVSNKKIRETLDRYTISCGEGCDIDYTIPLKTPKEEVISYWIAQYPKGMFGYSGGNEVIYKGGCEELIKKWVEEIQQAALELNETNILKWPGRSGLMYLLNDPVNCGYKYFLCEDRDQDFAEDPFAFVELLSELKPGTKLYIGGLLDYHY